jgi:hypothetical protein
MNTIKQQQSNYRLKNRLLGGLILVVMSIAATAQASPLAVNENFLMFLEHFQLEDSTTSRAYYTAVDPLNKRTTEAAWLKNAGFIANEANYVAVGSAGNPGDAEARSKAYSFALYRNAADLGFVRRMFIRCVPNCTTATNPNVYTYVENYKYLEGTADPFSDGKNRTNRVATVAFDWVSAANGTNPTKKFGTIYTIKGPEPGSNTTGLRDPGGVPFAPNLDGGGAKENPGVCMTCHGGFPQALVNGVYPNNGQAKGFKFLPFDLDNFDYDESGIMDPGTGLVYSRLAQEPAFKKFNQAVLLTHKGKQSVDDQGVTRFPAGKELIEGWYGGSTLPGNFNANFVPQGWREAVHGGTAPAGSENLYLKTIAPGCRGCHVQQELALDLATQKGFMSQIDNVKQLVLRIECGLSNSPAGRDDRRVMPLAHLTYDRFWDKDGGIQVNTLKDYLGLTSPVCN